MSPRPPRAANIVRMFNEASAAQLDMGERWYRDAHGAAASLDPDDPGRAAGVIAALSPQTPWARNLELAARMYADGELTGGVLGQSIRRATAIYNGAEPLNVLQGPKTRAFYQLIANPDDPDTVCVDRHAVDIAVGERLSVQDREARYPLAKRGWYQRFADCYRQAAQQLGVTPSVVQATTWVAQTDRWYGVRIGGLTHV
jgi:hypothetical protein